ADTDTYHMVRTMSVAASQAPRAARKAAGPQVTLCVTIAVHHSAHRHPSKPRPRAGLRHVTGQPQPSHNPPTRAMLPLNQPHVLGGTMRTRPALTATLRALAALTAACGKRSEEATLARQQPPASRAHA